MSATKEFVGMARSYKFQLRFLGLTGSALLRSPG